MGIILELLCEKITAVINPRNVSNVNLLGLVGFMDTLFMEVEIFGAIAHACIGPVDYSLIVVVCGDGAKGIVHTKILSTVFVIKILTTQASVTMILASQELHAVCS